MGLIVLGINHKSANLALRERVAFAPEQMTEALQGALVDAALAEAVILSTCNRTEMFVIVDDNAGVDGEQRVLEWLASYHQLSTSELQTFCYSYRDTDALRHMIHVASGLDSMILGEPQIFGQMKSAFAVAQEAQSVAREFSRIFPHVFSVAKRVRTDTAIGENPVSVAYAAVNLSQHIFADLTKTRALLIGAGETIELVARHLVENGVKDIVVANRTLGRAKELAQRFGAEAVLFSEIPMQLVDADIVISSTGSQLPILGKGAVEYALKQRKHRPILMVDIAVPRDIEEQVGELNDVYLYTVDDLTEIVDENMRNRQSEARKADKLIDEGIEHYHQRLRALDVVSTLKAYRQQSEQTRDAELEKALKQLAKGEPAEKILNQLARSLTNKFMHTPSIEMKKASVEGRDEFISHAQGLLGLTVDSSNSSDER
ncbi:MAG: glutamyl-tRNA reductase [Spongiibacteraceae bacterium]